MTEMEVLRSLIALEAFLSTAFSFTVMLSNGYQALSPIIHVSKLLFDFWASRASWCLPKLYYICFLDYSLIYVELLLVPSSLPWTSPPKQL